MFLISTELLPIQNMVMVVAEIVLWKFIVRFKTGHKFIHKSFFTLVQFISGIQVPIMQILEGHVALTTERLVIKNADKVTLNTETDEMIIYGIDYVEFKGKVFSDSSFERRLMKYILGEEVALMGHQKKN